MDTSRQEPPSSSDENTIAIACGQFDQDWRAGRSPQLGTYLSRCLNVNRNALLLELLRLDIHHRRRLGQSASIEMYLSLLPDDSAAICDYFRHVELHGQETLALPLVAATTDLPTIQSHLVHDPLQLPQWSAPRFRLIRSHAQGGLGEVFLAEDLEFQREVALKEIQRQKLHYPSARADFCREGKITGRLEHPNIAPVYSLGEFQDGRPFYVMRFIHGESLKDAIDKLHGRTQPKAPAAVTQVAGGAATQTACQDSTAAPAKHAARPLDGKLSVPKQEVELRHLLGRFTQVCNAVAYAHSKGVIHRDIKPANVMLGSFGETLLVDWGLGRMIGDAEDTTSEKKPAARSLQLNAPSGTQQGQIKGTPVYMSPEQARGNIALLGPATDIYSLGATLYTLLTGSMPVGGKTSDEVLSQVATGQITPPRQRAPERRIPKPLDAICMKAMAHDPADRYPQATDLAADIERFLADEPISVVAETFVSISARFGRKHKGLVVSLAIAGALLLLVTTGATLRESHLRSREQAARQEAEANFERAKTAVDEYIEAVKEPEILADARFKPLVKDLLADANRFYQTFVDSNQHRKDRLDELAHALYKVGFISQASGDIDDAKVAIAKAIDLGEQLVREHPTQPARQQELAETYNIYGLLLFDTQDAAGASASYNRAIELYEALTRAYPLQKEYMLGLAGVCNRLGAMQRNTGELRQSQANFERAIEMLEHHFAEHPQDAETRHLLARCHNSLGILQSEMAEYRAAESNLREAISHHEQLVHDQPAVAKFQNELTCGYNNLAVVQQNMLDPAAAQGSLQRAIQVAEKLVRQNPTVAEYQGHLTNSYYNLGILQRMSGDRVAAKASAQRAMELGHWLVHDNPSMDDLKIHLATYCALLGGVQLDAGDFEGARVSFQRARDVIEPAARENPEWILLQASYARTLTDQAIVEVEDQDFAKAKELLSQAEPTLARVLNDNPENAASRAAFLNNQMTLARALVGLGVHEQASAHAAKAAEYATNADDLLGAAEVLCKCITLAKNDGMLPEANRAAFEQQYGDTAVQLLQQLVAAGFTDAGALSVSEFQPIMLRKDYQRLLASLNAETKE